VAEVYRPIDVLEVQVGLIRFWDKHPDAPRVAQGYATLMHGALNVTDDTDIGRFLVPRLDQSETVFLRSHIQHQLWRWAAEVEPHRDEDVHWDDLPMKLGFCWLEQTLYVPDVYGDTMSVKAISWSEERNGVVIVTWSDPHDDNDDVVRQWKAELQANGRDQDAWMRQPLHVLHVQPWSWGQKVLSLTADQVSDRATSTDIYGMMTGTEEERQIRRSEMHDANVASINQFNHFLLMLWEFMGQQAPTPHFPDRPMRRRLAREGHPLSEVLVIELRPYPNTADPSEDPQQVVWSRRWRVREHKRRWRDKKTGEWRETTVSAHIKGPEYLPLIEKDRVFDVKR
jgi:hypothetical protein